VQIKIKLRLFEVRKDNKFFKPFNLLYGLVKFSQLIITFLLLSLFHFLFTYSLVINLLGLPQYKHVGEVIKIKFLHWGQFFFFHILILLNKIEIRNNK